MANGTRHSIKPEDAARVNPSPDSLHRVPRQAVEKREPAAQHVPCGQVKQDSPSAQAELPLRLSGPEHAQILQAVFEQERVGAAIVGLDGRIERANHALAELLLYRQDELAGRAFDGLLSGSKQARNSAGGAAARRGEPQTPPGGGQLTRKSGEKISCLVDFHALRNADGQITHFLVFVTDARSGKDAEERNRFETGLYQSQALQMLGMLAGGVAHDFNNALEVIIGFASLARVRLSADDPLYEPLKIIEESAAGAGDLARQLLEVCKGESDGQQDIDAGDLIGAVIAVISRTFDRRIRIERRVDPELPCIKGIRSRLKQAILNLCLNAREAMPRGGVLTLEASSEKLDPADSRLPSPDLHGQYVRIAVRDTGAGMTAEIREKIFVPLFSTKEPGQGSGLGLAMVDRIVKQAEGFISVASRPGAGSEFSLYFPAVFSEAPRAAHSRPSRLVSGRGKILVVDDELRVLQFLEKGLTRLGYEVVAAESGNRACEIYSRQSDEIHCVLLDLIMPGMSGLDTYNRLRDINPRVKVILSSGYSSGRLKHEALKAGSAEFLGKPYTIQELSQALRKVQQN